MTDRAVPDDVIAEAVMVEFKGGLFCAAGFGTGMDLEAFRAHLASVTVQRSKAAFAARLRENRELRDLTERKTAVSLGFFLRCAREPEGFFRDPVFIDRSVLDLRDWTQHFTRQGWPDLHRTLAELERLASQTKAERLAMITAKAAPTRGAPN